MLKLNEDEIIIIKEENKNLNTSHVKVKPLLVLCFRLRHLYLNTSHVKVKRVKLHFCAMFTVNGSVILNWTKKIRTC